MVLEFGMAGWRYRDGSVHLVVAETRHYAFDLLFNDQTKGFWDEVEEGIGRVCGYCDVMRSENFTGFDVTSFPDASARIREYI